MFLNPSQHAVNELPGIPTELGELPVKPVFRMPSWGPVGFAPSPSRDHQILKGAEILKGNPMFKLSQKIAELIW